MKPYPKYKKSDLEWIGEIPEHWYILPIRCGIEFLTDFEANGSFSTIKENVNVDRGEPYAWYVRATDLENNRTGIVDENRFCDFKTYQFLSKTSLAGGELLVTKRGEIGKIYLLPELTDPATLGPNLYLLRLNKKLYPKFTYFWFKCQLGRPQLIIANKSTTIGAIYKEDLKDCLCTHSTALRWNAYSGALRQS